MGAETGSSTAPADSPVFHKSLVGARALAQRTILTKDTIAIHGRGRGLAPATRSLLIGRRLGHDFRGGEWEMFS